MPTLPDRPGRLRLASPDLDENISGWSVGQENYQPSPPLKGTHAAAVVIIGGGFTGVSTAWFLHQRFPERRIILLEGKTVGNGASGRNGGMMLNWINGVDSSDPELTKLVYETTRSGIDGIVDLIEKEKLDVPYRRDGCLELFTKTERAEAAEKEVARMNRWGIPVKWYNEKDVRQFIRAEGVKGGIFDSSVGQVHGLRLVRAMKQKLQGRVEFYENSPVLSIREGRILTVKTAEGEVQAEALVLGTNGYTPRLGYFRSAICPMHAHMICTDPLPPEVWEKLGWSKFTGFSDDLDRIAYGGMTTDGSLVFGGGGNFAYGYRYGNRTHFPPDQADFAGVRKRMLDYLPALADVPIRRKWTGTLGVTLDRSCSMGVRGEYKNIYYALGYSGHGVTLANLAGRVLSDIYAGEGEKWAKLPFYQRRLYPMPGEPLRYLGYHLVTRLTGKSPRKRK